MKPVAKTRVLRVDRLRFDSGSLEVSCELSNHEIEFHLVSSFRYAGEFLVRVVSRALKLVGDRLPNGRTGEWVGTGEIRHRPEFRGGESAARTRVFSIGAGWLTVQS